MKLCKKCRILKPKACFYKHDRMLDGFLNVCKICTLQRTRKYRSNNIDRIRKYDRERIRSNEYKNQFKEYLQDPLVKLSLQLSRKKWNLKNKEKRIAHSKLWIELKRGNIKKKNCKVCGDKKTEAHHHDYTQPLSVIWLCHKHHAEEHKKIRQKQKR